MKTHRLMGANLAAFNAFTIPFVDSVWAAEPALSIEMAPGSEGPRMILKNTKGEAVGSASFVYNKGDVFLNVAVTRAHQDTVFMRVNMRTGLVTVEP